MAREIAEPSRIWYRRSCNSSPPCYGTWLAPNIGLEAKPSEERKGGKEKGEGGESERRKRREGKKGKVRRMEGRRGREGGGHD